MDKETLLQVIERDPGRSWPIKELMSSAGLHDGKEKVVRRLLKGLVTDGVIEREPGRRYRLSRIGRTVEGVVRLDERGRTALAVDGAPPREPPIPLRREDLALVEPGTRVRAKIVVGRRGAASIQIVEVLSGRQGREMGVLRKVGKVLFVEAEGSRERGPAGPLLVEPPLPEGAVDGMLVLFEISRPRTASHGGAVRVVECLGRPGERETELRRLMFERALVDHFPPEVEAAAARFGSAPDPNEVARRRDLRNIALVTIDGEDARDFDDAVCVEKHGEHAFKLYVAIADVSHYVQAGDAIDREAFQRATSTYLTDRVFPMLPEALSNELCSLKPNVDRLCLVAELTIDREGHLQKSDFYPAVMRSRARLTYTQVARALDGQPDDKTGPLLPSLVLLYKVAQLRLKQRLLRGAIDLDLPESQIVFDAEGNPVDVRRRERNDAHRLIEDLMLAANEAVAAYFEDRDLPTIFRVHEDPDPMKLEAFVDLCQRIGISVRLKRGKVRPKDVALLLDELSEHPSGKHFHALLLRTLAQARYYPENEGHFGLAAERYLHFTSPIRRYPDLMVHRMLTAHLAGRASGYSPEELRQIAEQSSTREREAALAERACRDLDRTLVAALHVGEALSGTITGIHEFGVFVAVDEPFIEGMVPIQYLGDDFFEFDEAGAFLVGRHSGQKLFLGMPIAVEVARVNIARRQVELRPTGATPFGEAPVELSRAIEAERSERGARSWEDRRDRGRGGRRQEGGARGGKERSGRRGGQKHAAGGKAHAAGGKAHGGGGKAHAGGGKKPGGGKKRPGGGGKSRGRGRR